jgi:hypothetical protein
VGAVVTQFQDFMDKNNKSIGENKFDRSAEYKNLHAGHVNEMRDAVIVMPLSPKRIS